VYAPSNEDIYNNNIVSEVFDFSGLDKIMEGTHRKGHFNGVATIVKHLLLIIKPNKAYFGEKDFQQLQIIKKLVEDYQIPVKIVGCPIIREQNGLAMSSRNKRLTKTQRELAPFIHKTLKTAKEKFGTKSATKISEWVNYQFSKQPLLELEYFVIADAKTLKKVIRKSNKKSYRAFIAVYIGEVRLIDNMALN
jgi:pantoate--beta-alanine ligase